MPDELRHDYLTSFRARREGRQLNEFLVEHLSTGTRDTHGALRALAGMFAVLADCLQADPEAAFSQVLDALQRDDALPEDPARSRFVHPEHRIKN
jgi:hypothetical protein